MNREEYFGTTASASYIIPSHQTNGGTGDLITVCVKPILYEALTSMAPQPHFLTIFTFKHDQDAWCTVHVSWDRVLESFGKLLFRLGVTEEET